MRPGSRFQFLVALLLMAVVGMVALTGLRDLRASTDLASARDQATQQFASAVAAALDRGSVTQLRETVRAIMAAHPDVLAAEVVPTGAGRVVGLGDLARLEAQPGGAASEVREVSLIRGGRPWGSVRVAFAPRVSHSLVHPESPLTWAIAALAIVGLPVAVALLEAARRRFDRSAGGHMAVSAQRARDTLDTLAECVLLLDADARIVFANEAFCTALRATPASLAGRPVADLPWSPPPGVPPPAALPWASVMQAAAPVRGVRLGLGAGPDSPVFIVNCTPLFLRGRKLHGLLVTLDEVTELEQGRVALQEARDAAQHANEAKSRFLAMMSHEIRTPLNGVCGSLQLLAATPLQGGQTRYVDAARFSASTLLHLINDILDFSKIEAGQMELSPIPMDLERCVDDTMLMMAQPAHARRLAVAYGIEPGVARWLLADPDRLRQVIVNLLNNAIKFTERGSVTLRVAVDREAPGRQRLRFDVADTGIGIPRAKMDRLFRPFSQVDSSTSRRYGGTGLGLVISRQLCELMGGSIEVRSEEGRGTVFTFYLDLPRAAPPEPAEAPRCAPDFAGVLAIGLHELEVQTIARALGIDPDRVAACDDPGALASLLGRWGARPPEPMLVVLGADTAADVVARRAAIPESLRPASWVLIGATPAQADRPTGADSGIDAWLTRPLGRRRLLEALAEARGERRDSPAPDGPADQPRSLAGIRVLLAEDNPVGQMVVSEMLAGAGASCDAVGDGKAAVAAVLQNPYDLVLMDCFMPDMDGFEATRELRELQRAGAVRRDLPVIALTAKAMRGDREECLRAGMDGYLTKPVDQTELLRVIAEHLRGDPMSNDPNANTAEMDEIAGLRDQYGNKPDLLARLIAAFREAASQDLQKIRQALSARDGATVEQAAHRLAGGAGFVHAERVRRLAKTLEEDAARGHWQDLQAVADQLQSELARSIADLQRLAGSLPAPAAPARTAQETQQ